MHSIFRIANSTYQWINNTTTQLPILGCASITSEYRKSMCLYFNLAVKRNQLISHCAEQIWKSGKKSVKNSEDTVAEFQWIRRNVNMCQFYLALASFAWSNINGTSVLTARKITLWIKYCITFFSKQSAVAITLLSLTWSTIYASVGIAQYPSTAIYFVWG